MNSVQLRSLDLNLLVVLHQLLRSESATKAAERLGLTPSAVSHALRRLRDELGDPLFVREGHKLVPTARASALADPLQRVLGEIERLLAGDAPLEPATLARTFTIGATDYAQLVLLPRLLGRLAEEAPKVELQILSPGNAVDALVRERHLDLALGTFFSPLPGLYSSHLFEERFVVLARRGHPLLRRGLNLERYAAADHVLVAPRATPGSVVDRALATQQLERRVVVRTPHFAVAAHLVAESDALATVPERAAAVLAPPFDLVVREPPLEVPGFRFGVLYGELDRYDPAHTWFRGLLAEVASASGAAAPRPRRSSQRRASR